MTIEFRKSIDGELSKIIDFEFNKFANENQVQCGFTPFCLVAWENDKIIGVLTGHTYYNEVHISDFIIIKEYRRKRIGIRMLAAVEEQYKNKGFENINLSTYAFQAPEFYEKCGYQTEFIRANSKNPKLTKYFFVKHLGKSI